MASASSEDANSPGRKHRLHGVSRDRTASYTKFSSSFMDFSIPAAKIDLARMWENWVLLLLRTNRESCLKENELVAMGWSTGK